MVFYLRQDKLPYTLGQLIEQLKGLEETLGSNCEVQVQSHSQVQRFEVVYMIGVTHIPPMFESPAKDVVFLGTLTDVKWARWYEENKDKGMEAKPNERI